jgi:hypothetical protein
MIQSTYHGAFLSTTGRLLRAGKLQLDTSQSEASILFKRSKHEIER